MKHKKNKDNKNTKTNEIKLRFKKGKKMLLLSGNASFWYCLTSVLLFQLFKMDILDLRIKLTFFLSQDFKYINFGYGYTSLYIHRRGKD